MDDEKMTTQEVNEDVSSKNKNNSVNIAIPKKNILIAVLIVVLFAATIVGMRIHEKKALDKVLDDYNLPSADETLDISNEVTVTVSTLREAIAPAKEIVSYKYYYTDAGLYQKDKKFFNSDVSIPLTKNQQVYVYSGTIGAGLDIDDIDFDINESSRKITVKMPALKIVYHSMDTDNFQSYDVKSSIFTKTSLTDYADFQKELQAYQEEKLEGNKDFWNEAEKNAENTIEGLLTVSGLVDDYVIQFDWQ